jgi:hypothetical protein
VSKLFERLGVGSVEHELVLFDVNRASRTKEFLKADKGAYLASLESGDKHPYRLTVITNVGEDSAEVLARTRPAFSDVASELALGLAWPRSVYSLAHVAIPFPEDDPVYGALDGEPAPDAVYLGAMAPRGEVNVLTVPASQFLRLRHNPFHDYMLERVGAALAADVSR